MVLPSFHNVSAQLRQQLRRLISNQSCEKVCDVCQKQKMIEWETVGIRLSEINSMPNYEEIERKRVLSSMNQVTHFQKKENRIDIIRQLRVRDLE
jgi:hypothetical protein